MKTMLLRKFLPVALILALAPFAPAADRIELTDGSVVLGKLVSAEAGKFKVETSFAGTIEIAQDKIKSFTTDEAVNVQLAAGRTVTGKVAPAEAGITVVAVDTQVGSPTDKVAAVWRAGADSPETRKIKEAADKLKHHWKYEAAVAVTGRTGGAENFNAALGFKATRENSKDKLVMTASVQQSEDNGVETANRQFAGADYSAFISDRNVWYARTSVEHDAINQIDFRSSSAVGLGHKLIKKEVQDLELRLGLSYRYETYPNGTDFDSPGLDVALIHSYQFKNGKMNNAVSYTPTFEDFGNYRIHHESTFEMPIAASLWKFKVGMTNDYTSMPQPGIERLDTLYFSSLILSWE